MTPMTDHEVRGWISADRAHGVNINSGILNDLATELLAARAKLEAAEKLAEALDAWGNLYRGWSRAQLARRVDAPTEKRFYDGEAALAAWEAA